MKDWADTLAARQSGYCEGFLAADIPLEDQDLAEGGPLATPAVDEEAPKTRTGKPAEGKADEKSR